MQHLSVKIFEQSGAELNGTQAIAVFHRWIQRGGIPEMPIDVADYAHIPAGPGVILVCQKRPIRWIATMAAWGCFISARPATIWRPKTVCARLTIRR